MKVILIILAIVMTLACVLVGGVVAAVAAVLYGAAPRCAVEPSMARSESDMALAMDQTGVLVVTDAEASALARTYLADVVQESRVCFTPGLAHLSGKVKMGGATPSFYASLGVDLTGRAPKVTDVDVKVGSLPSIPGLSDAGKKAVNDAITENLSEFSLDRPYAVDFSQGSVAIRKL